MGELSIADKRRILLDLIRQWKLSRYRSECEALASSAIGHQDLFENALRNAETASKFIAQYESQITSLSSE